MALKTTQEILFDSLNIEADKQPSTIFILAAPRAGSTSFYKSLIEQFSLPYIANITNEKYAKDPIVGFAKQKSENVKISYDSKFGKTKGMFQPSEGSNVFTNWFGGGHPSQIVSKAIKKDMQKHFSLTLNGVEKLYGAPLLVKNAWNCFRVQYLAQALPNAKFIWLQRDITDAASSDLQARLITKNDVNSWNSATPANYEQLLKRPAIEQVMENQYEFNSAIKNDLKQYAQNRWLHVWFEDYINKPDIVMKKISSAFKIDQKKMIDNISLGAPEGKKLSLSEQNAIKNYANIEQNKLRFKDMFYEGEK